MMKYQHPVTHYDAAADMVLTPTHKTFCEGTGGAGGHPRVYLKIETDDTSVTCPYCSRLFILNAASL